MATVTNSDPRMPLPRILRGEGDQPVGTPAGSTRAALAAGQPGFDISSFLRTLRRRWLVIAAVVGAALLYGIVVLLTTTPLYRGSVLLEVRPETFEAIEGASVDTGVSDVVGLQTQYGLLQSRALADMVAADQAASGNGPRLSAGQLIQNLQVEPVANTRLIRLNYVDPDPARAAAIANSFAENFIQGSLDRRIDSTAYAREFLTDQMQQTKAALEQSERDLAAFAMGAGIIQTQSDTGQGGSTTIEETSLESLNMALAQATADRIRAEADMRSGASEASAQPSATENQLRGQLRDLEQEYRQKSETFLPQYPEMQRLSRQIETARQQLVAERVNRSDQGNESLTARYQAAVGREAQLQAQVTSLREKVSSMRGQNVDYNVLAREVESNRSLYEALLQRAKEVGVGSNLSQSEVTIVDRASVPGSPFEPKPLIIIGSSLLVGLLGGVALALLLDILGDRIERPVDVTQRLGLPLIGIVPRLEESEDFMTQLADVKSSVSEAYSSIRTQLNFHGSGGGFPKTLLVTSTTPNEGKTSSGLALAVACQRIGQRTLLIDADLRHPSFRLSSGRSEGSGLSEYLASEVTLDETIKPSQRFGFSVIPSGRIPPDPADLLATGRFREMLQDLQNRFDVVVVDGPPVLGLSDSPLLTGVCDATLFVMQAGKLRRPAVAASLDRLRENGGNVVGGLLTKFERGHDLYGHDYRYDYKYHNDFDPDKRSVLGFGQNEREKNVRTRYDL